MTQIDTIRSLLESLEESIEYELQNDTARVDKKHFAALVKRRNALLKAIKTFEKTEGKVYG